MNKLLSLLVAFFAFATANAQESGNYYLYAYDKTNAANIYIQLTSADGDMFSATGNTFNGSTDLSGIQVIYGNWEKNYAPAADTWPEVKLGTVVDLVEGGTGSGWVYDWTLAETNYIYFQLSTLKLAISEDSTNPIAPTTAIKPNVADAQESPVYYDMQGIRLAKPAPGLCIVKQGGKTRKVMVR